MGAALLLATTALAVAPAGAQTPPTPEAVAAGKLHHIAQDLALIQSMGVRVVLVHGFRPQVNEQLRAKGHEAKYSHGMRITDEVALDSAQEAAGQLRYEIEAAFRIQSGIQLGPGERWQVVYVALRMIECLSSTKSIRSASPYALFCRKW